MSLILLYHRVTRIESDPQLLAVTPEHFDEHLGILKRLTNPLSLEALVGNLRRSEISERDIAITFDDGYADNAIEAAPILSRDSVPATFFVTTALENRNQEFFWDDLDRIFLTPGRLPPNLSLGDYRADLNEAAAYDPEQYRRHLAWNVLNPENPTARQRIYRELASLLHQSDVMRRKAWLIELRQWAGVSHSGRDSHRIMTSDELRAVTADGLITIGGHTIDHPVLGIEDLSSQRHQISTNKSALEGTIGRSISGFSYPFGTRRDFTPETISLVKNAGYGFACANFTGRVTDQSDPFQLPRFIVRDWAGAEFEQRLTQWLGKST